jgi:hypothetical protein
MKVCWNKQDIPIVTKDYTFDHKKSIINTYIPCIFNLVAQL